MLIFLIDVKVVLVRKYRGNKSIETLKLEKAALEGKVLVMEDALECSKKEINILNMMLESKNEVVILNKCIINVLIFILTVVVFKLIVMTWIYTV